MERIQARLELGVRVDRPGVVFSDFQTVALGQPHHDGTGWTTRGRVEAAGGGSSDGTHIRYRDYYADACHTVALTLRDPEEEPTLDTIKRALRHPERPLFIGRKTCLPAAPLLLMDEPAPEGELEAADLLDALTRAPLAKGSASADTLTLWLPCADGAARRSPATTATGRIQIHTGRRTIRQGSSPGERRRPSASPGRCPMAGVHPLHLVQLRLDLPRLLRSARLSRYHEDKLDLGYLVHTFLDSAFGAASVRPFVIPALSPGMEGALGHTSGVEVLGYSERDAEGLTRAAQELATPEHYNVLTDVLSKPMPTTWSEGRALRVGLRVCPTTRRRHPRPRPRRSSPTPSWPRCPAPTTKDVPLSRGQVHTDWLRASPRPRGRRGLVAARLEGFRLVRLLRRTQGEERSHKLPQLPEAWFDLDLEVRDSAAFIELLRRGVGRHRAFGFGMIVLRRAERR
ncbi:MAG: type I-E CRISPR-associated protein Cas5/CasD [Deltaproteobacteria bacterium]|nr:type I-E CRISPR-associated protein Cas5/CasD [Deltaproteobacteria bacterium]